MLNGFLSGFGLCLDSRCSHLQWIRRFGWQPGWFMHGRLYISPEVQICRRVDLNAKDSEIRIGRGCDIADFVTISCADSHARCVGRSTEIERRPIHIGDRVFIGQGAIILGGTEIGDGSVIGAGAVLKGARIPAGSTVRPATPIITEPMRPNDSA